MQNQWSMLPVGVERVIQGEGIQDKLDFFAGPYLITPIAALALLVTLGSARSILASASLLSCRQRWPIILC